AAQRSEPVQVRRLEEQPPLARFVPAPAEDPFAIDEIAPLAKRPVASVDDCAGPKLVGREEIGEHPISGAVELRDAANEELTRELVGRSAVDDVQVVDALTGTLAIE